MTIICGIDGCSKEATGSILAFVPREETVRGCPTCGNPEHTRTVFHAGPKVPIETASLCDEHIPLARAMNHPIIAVGSISATQPPERPTPA
jgi:hypothetical protein